MLKNLAISSNFKIKMLYADGTINTPEGTE